MANRRGDRPYVTVILRVTENEHAVLKEKKQKKTWEEYFLGLAGI